MKVRAALVALLAAMASGPSCGGNAMPNDHFVNGTIPRGGYGQVHQFTVSRDGEYTFTVTSLTPNTNVYFLMQYGQMSGNQCVPIQANYAVVGVAGLYGVITTGNYCVVLADSLNAFTVDEAYTLKLSYP